MSFFVPETPIITSQIVKKSEFIGLAFCVKSRQEAMTIVAKTKAMYPQARHHCWAYSIGHPIQPIAAAMNDDGEPSGTAGKPIYNVLKHSNIGHILVIVVRYFGGIKLGTGGLVRAYSSCAQATVDALSLIEYVAHVEVSIVCPFELEAQIRHTVQSLDGQTKHTEYSNSVALTCTLPLSAVSKLKDAYAAQQHCVVIAENHRI